MIFWDKEEYTNWREYFKLKVITTPNSRRFAASIYQEIYHKMSEIFLKSLLIRDFQEVKMMHSELV